MKPRRLKRTVVKEELVALTGDYIKAIILNQFIYWSERVKDFDKFIEEEKARAAQNGIDVGIALRNGWIYKTADELSAETMLNLAHNTMRRHMKYLVDNKWIEQRTNPDNKWDKTTQYRVNLIKINNDLIKIGYILQDYKIDIPLIPENDEISQKENGESKCDNRMSILDNRLSDMDEGISKREIGMSKTDDGKSFLDNRSSQNGQAIPEITSEITSETTTDNVAAVSEIINEFMEATGYKLDNKLVMYLISNWPIDYIKHKIEVCRNSNITDSAVGFFIKALENNYTLPQPKQKSSTGQNQSNTRKKEFVKTLYLS